MLRGETFKITSITDLQKIQGRWYPFHYRFKDELKRNIRSTEWILSNVEFNS